MTALAANKRRHRKMTEAMVTWSGIGTDSTTFYQGGLLCFNNAGRIAKAADTANFKTCGVAKQTLTTGSSNTKRIQFEWGHAEWFPINGTDIDNTSIGKNAIISDDQTLTNAATATNDVPIGKVLELETIDGVSGAWVHVAIFAPTNA